MWRGVGLEVLDEPVHDGLGLVGRPVDRQGRHALGSRRPTLQSHVLHSLNFAPF